MNWIINDLHRGIFCVLWLAPFVGAAENRSMWPLLLLPLPMICSVLPRLLDLACRSDQPTLALWSVFIALAVLCVVLIDFGLVRRTELAWLHLFSPVTSPALPY